MAYAEKIDEEIIETYKSALTGLVGSRTSDEEEERHTTAKDAVETHLNIPSALTKALMDDCFEYAIGVKSGTIFRFRGASLINKEWIHIHGCYALGFEREMELMRGVQIRISDIAWVADAAGGNC